VSETARNERAREQGSQRARERMNEPGTAGSNLACLHRKEHTFGRLSQQCTAGLGCEDILARSSKFGRVRWRKMTGRKGGRARICEGW